jgi:hypothetical protein
MSIQLVPAKALYHVLFVTVFVGVAEARRSFVIQYLFSITFQEVPLPQG